MTSTFTATGRAHPEGVGRKRIIGTLDITSIGSTTGEAVSPSKFLLGLRVDRVTQVGQSDNGEWQLAWDSANQKVTAKPRRGKRTLTLLDIKGGDFATAGADQGATHTNGAFVLALSDAEATGAGNLAHVDGVTAGLVNPNTSGAPYGRNITVVQKANTAGVTFTAANIVVTGTDQFGNAITETIAIQTGAVAMDNFRWTIGTKIFATVTKVTLSAAQPANAQISIGLGTILGLPHPISAETDIIAVLKNGANVAAATYVGNTTYGAVDPGADLADNDDLTVTYDPQGHAPSGTDIGAIPVEVIGV